VTSIHKYLEAVQGRKGQFISAKWQSQVKTAAAHKHLEVVKISHAVVRTGIDYANLRQNEDHETGELPWGEWSNAPWIIEHRGEHYLRLYIAEDASVNSSYLMNGEPTTRETVQELLTPSSRNRPKSGPTLTFTVKWANLLDIG
jgi:hypothetical protein